MHIFVLQLSGQQIYIAWSIVIDGYTECYIQIDGDSFWWNLSCSVIIWFFYHSISWYHHRNWKSCLGWELSGYAEGGNIGDRSLGASLSDDDVGLTRAFCIYQLYQTVVCELCLDGQLTDQKYRLQWISGHLDYSVVCVLTSVCAHSVLCVWWPLVCLCDSLLCVCDGLLCVCDSVLCVCDSVLCVCDGLLCVCDGILCLCDSLFCVCDSLLWVL